jgi:hypothetical protein
MGWKLAAFIGIVLIAATASLIVLPFSDSTSEKKEGPNNPLQGTFQNMRSAESNMMNFINQEKTEIAAQLQQFSHP